jgi:hypothetical protein
MEELEHFVERLRYDIQVRSGRSVQKKMAKDKTYYLYSPKSFAWIRQVMRGRVIPDRCFPIQVREKLANRVGVATSAKRKHIPKGWYTEYTVEWHVLEDDQNSYKEAMEALSKICKML